jgi:hypothetical protein
MLHNFVLLVSQVLFSPRKKSFIFIQVEYTYNNPIHKLTDPLDHLTFLTPLYKTMFHPFSKLKQYCCYYSKLVLPTTFVPKKVQPYHSLSISDRVFKEKKIFFTGGIPWPLPLHLQ